MIRQEGCLSEKLPACQDNPGELISYSEWESEAAIDSFRKTAAHDEILRLSRRFRRESGGEALRTREIEPLTPFIVAGEPRQARPQFQRHPGVLEVNWSKLPRSDPRTGDYLAVVETTRGSRHKYAFDPELNMLRLKTVLPQGSVFPFDFGFIPSTKANDGDPIDVLILLDEPATAGCIIPVRLLGAIEAEQKSKETDWVRNDRLIAIATHAHDHSDAKKLKDLPSHLLSEIEAFFEHYDRLQGKDFRVLNRRGPKTAAGLVEKAAT